MQSLNLHQRTWISRNSVRLLSAVFLLLLLVKFFWPVFVYRVPLGYDLGFYRYLFVRHADGFPPFAVAPMNEWAKGHPLGLFFFSTILLKLGMPVSWLLGWIWNLFPVLLAAVLAWVTGKREGTMTGVLVLLAALLSIAYFDGFAAMYWKTYASLLWCVVSYRLLEKKSWWAGLTGILAVATHHQTGLIFGLVFASWVFINFLKEVRHNPRQAFLRALPPFVIGFVILLIGLLWYLPVWSGAVLEHIPTLLAGESSAGGNFPPALFYLRTEGILLAFGAVGFGISFKRERFTLWQLSVLWTLVFVAGQLLFYRRFFLQLDFFLLPFAAIAIRSFWNRFSLPVFRVLLVVCLLIQTVIMVGVIITRTPVVSAADVAAVEAFSNTLPNNALMLGLDNQTVTMLRGWLPYMHVAGPGLFENMWDYTMWERFILGTHEERVALLAGLKGDVYIFVSPFFREYYGPAAEVFVKDSCFKETVYPTLFIVTCTSPL